jgi:hypothetical protein
VRLRGDRDAEAFSDARGFGCVDAGQQHKELFAA